MFFCNVLVLLLVATWALLGTSSALEIQDDTDISKNNIIDNQHAVVSTTSNSSDQRDGRGLLSKHFPGVFQASGSLAASNSINLFGKYLSSAFAMTYGTRGGKDKSGNSDKLGSTFESAAAAGGIVSHNKLGSTFEGAGGLYSHDGNDEKAHVTFVKAVATAKRPVEVFVISNEIPGGVDAEFVDEDSSLSSYLEENKLASNSIDGDEHSGTGKNIIALKEKNTNLIKLITNLASNYSIQVKQIVPFDNVPSDLKTKIIKNLVGANTKNKDPCYVIVINGDEETIDEVLGIRGLSVTRVGREGLNSYGKDASSKREGKGMKSYGKEKKSISSEKEEINAKALNSLEKEQIEELKRKLNKTEPVKVEVEKPRECSSFTLYVF